MREQPSRSRARVDHHAGGLRRSPCTCNILPGPQRHELATRHASRCCVRLASALSSRDERIASSRADARSTTTVETAGLPTPVPRLWDLSGRTDGRAFPFTPPSNAAARPEAFCPRPWKLSLLRSTAPTNCGSHNLTPRDLGSTTSPPTPDVCLSSPPARRRSSGRGSSPWGPGFCVMRSRRAGGRPRAFARVRRSIGLFVEVRTQLRTHWLDLLPARCMAGADGDELVRGSQCQNGRTGGSSPSPA